MRMLTLSTNRLAQATVTAVAMLAACGGGSGDFDAASAVDRTMALTAARTISALPAIPTFPARIALSAGPHNAGIRARVGWESRLSARSEGRGAPLTGIE